MAEPNWFKNRLYLTNVTMPVLTLRSQLEGASRRDDAGEDWQQHSVRGPTVQNRPCVTYGLSKSVGVGPARTPTESLLKGQAIGVGMHGVNHV